MHWKATDLDTSWKVFSVTTGVLDQVMYLRG